MSVFGVDTIVVRLLVEGGEPGRQDAGGMGRLEEVRGRALPGSRGGGVRAAYAPSGPLLAALLPIVVPETPNNEAHTRALDELLRDPG